MQPKSLRSLLVLFLLGTVACVTNPSGRQTKTFTPTGNSFTCVEPPDDEVLESSKASVDIKVAKIGEILKADASVAQKVQQIREQSRGIQDFEVVDYRLCIAVVEGRLSKAKYEEFVNHVFKQLVIETPTSTEYSKGKKDGQAVRGITNVLAQFYEEKGRYPSSLNEVQVAEYVSVLGETRIRYSPNEQRGYELRFAGQDGLLDTSDDKQHYGREVTPSQPEVRP